MPEIETTINAVTVYTNRARVMRQGAMMLDEGRQTVVITNLPSSLEPDSVRVGGRGEEIEILSVEVKSVYLTNPRQQSLAALTKQLEDLQLQDYALYDEDCDLESQLALLDAARDSGGQSFARKIANQRADTDDLTNFARYIKTEQSQIRAARRDIMMKRKKLATEMDAIKSSISHYDNEPGEERYEISITLAVEKVSRFEVDLVYAVLYPSWQSHYDVRLKDDEVELTYLATVTQRSGEDWENVELVLSTARPALTSNLPELRPHYLTTHTPHRMTAGDIVRGIASTVKDGIMKEKTHPGMPDALRKQRSEEEMKRGSASRVRQAEVKEGTGAALTYRTPTPATITSDGTPYKATVTIQKLSVKLDYFTIPKMAEEAYLRATITNTSAFTLLPGVASIYHGAEFVGKTSIKTIAPNEEFEAQLGVDDRIKVKRELLQREVSKKFIGSNRLVQFAYKITVHNLTNAPARITVDDQIPVSQNERIQVKLLSATPAISEQDKLNILTWTLNLKPQEKQEITFTYTVEHPRDMDVVGLG